ncbi:MAG: UDP-N-acetylglucosamine 2-epimerase [Candidatus Ancaeobacter aquaticus]|nr:UDP-N-acetylglucosamine 2-epimerase [Candidatus Ancaeobacter aquaticus]
MRKIAIITGSRAEYGLLYCIIKAVHKDPVLKLQLMVTGMHLSPEFGLTVNRIEKDGFPITEKIEILLSSDTPQSISSSMGLGTILFGNAYERIKPDIILVLGDRFEIFSAVSAAVPFRIPVAHIHGGETTEGAIDESFRHAITKMSHIHFASTKVYRKRIMQMGERKENIFCFGAPGIENIVKLPLKNRSIYKNIGIPEGKKYGIVTYHPVTLEKNKAKQHIDALLKSLDRYQDMYWLFSLPNADTEGRIILKRIEEYTKTRIKNTKIIESIGQLHYLSLLKYASIMVGNSSSGIIEAPSFHLPVVNIGNRQKGRIRANNVIDVKGCRDENIAEAIKIAISPQFKNSLSAIKNPYGNGNTSKQIVEVLKSINMGESLLKKKFFDIEQ